MKYLILVLTLFSSLAFGQQNSIVAVPVPLGNRPYLQAVGPDSTIYMDYYCKGNCAHVWRGFDGAAHAFVAYAQSPAGRNFLEAHGTVGPPELRATGPGTSIGLMLRPQGMGVVLARNAVQIVDISPDGVITTIGFIGSHKAIFGGTSNDLAIRAESGNAIRFFIGQEEVGLLSAPNQSVSPFR